MSTEYDEPREFPFVCAGSMDDRMRWKKFGEDKNLSLSPAFLSPDTMNLSPGLPEAGTSP